MKQPSTPRAPRLREAAGGVRHGAGFVVSGALAFATDALVLAALTHAAGLDAYVARAISIAVAMVVGWRAHRRLTFGVASPPRLVEFVRYAGVASGAAAVNYTVFALLIASVDGMRPLAALVAATAVAMGVSYLGMRFGVFRRT